jgi:hypothetical protein
LLEKASVSGPPAQAFWLVLASVIANVPVYTVLAPAA